MQVKISHSNGVRQSQNGVCARSSRPNGASFGIVGLSVYGAPVRISYLKKYILHHGVKRKGLASARIQAKNDPTYFACCMGRCAILQDSKLPNPTRLVNQAHYCVSEHSASFLHRHIRFFTSQSFDFELSSHLSKSNFPCQLSFSSLPAASHLILYLISHSIQGCFWSKFLSSNMSDSDQETGSWSEMIFTGGSDGINPYFDAISAVEGLWLFSLILVAIWSIVISRKRYRSTQPTANLYIFWITLSIAIL